MTMHDLYQAVLDDPDANQPRLAYAAACDERGEHDRAEFIRLQMEMVARMRRGREDWWEPSSAARDLAKERRAEWAGPVASRVSWYDFHRGFVEEIETDARTFLANADELVALAPIRRLHLKGVKPVIRELLASPHLARIVSLSMRVQKLDDGDIALLAASPHVKRLASLDFAGNDITVAGIEALAASSGLPSLRKISIIGNPASELAEDVGYDQGALIDARPGSAETLRLEEKFGRKTWLHTVEDHGMRQLHDAEL